MATTGNKQFLKAGRLDTPLEVYYYTNTQNEYGEISQSKTLLKTIWGEMMTETLKKIRKKNKIFNKMNIGKKIIMLLNKYDVSEKEIQKLIVKEMFYIKKQSKISIIKDLANLLIIYNIIFIYII